MSSAIENQRFRKLLRSYPAAAVEQLYMLLGKGLTSYAFKLTSDSDAAKDIVQEAFLYVLANSKKLSKHHEQSIEHYLIRIVRNKAISYFKRVRHLDIEALLLSGARFMRETEKSIETSIIEEEIIEQVREFVQTFPPREQECFLLLIDHNLSLDEIASRLKVSRKAVEANITRSRKRLRKWGDKLNN